MPAKKKNGFMILMIELQEEFRRDGRNVPMQEMPTLAAPKWKLLSAMERDRYDNEAKGLNQQARNIQRNALVITDTGETEEQKMERNKRERELVQSEWTSKPMVARQKFYLMNWQTLCKTEEGHYVPGEVACVEYSLEKGIMREFHRFIAPGEIPKGYAYKCKQTCEDTHKIPYQNFKLAKNDYKNIYTELCNFVRRDRGDCSPVYLMGMELAEAEYRLSWLAWCI
ncbi:PREDICTED: protein maelstrom homolog isoform X3 [Priapulus caudatus]|uniref:Protein maelstrom homolog isoform X3 n=1 Tax=Priapulus caudatus TaxID=37621 RepID=A0ABM1EI61_PRICU|nr:PREDICTED: protein maelstrom homolog isoform X3 [Priapulus caudatus]